MKTKWGLVAIAILAAMILGGCKSAGAPPAKEFESHRAQDLLIALLSEKEGLAQGQNRFVIEFRSVNNNKPVDAGKVTVESSMAMPGMAPMTAPIELEPAGKTGRYAVKADFGMSGAWRFEVRWEGPAGQGSASFNSNVR